jgi:hypothetical protein
MCQFRLVICPYDIIDCQWWLTEQTAVVEGSMPLYFSLASAAIPSWLSFQRNGDDLVSNWVAETGAVPSEWRR